MMAICVKNKAKEVVGETKSSILENKKIQWWDEQIQRLIASKKKQCKLWQKSRKIEQRIKICVKQ